MLKICDNDLCTGCMACVNACAQNAIRMQPNSEGFLYPVVDESLCKNCGLCSRICPNNNPIAKEEPKAVYSGWSKDENLRMQSSSGGAFSEIALQTLRRGGVVFGCVLNEKLNVEHTFVENESDLEKIRGSKYVQSYIGDSYKRARSFLNEGREVLFSGTSCQIAGLKAFLKKEYSNLLTVDIICHGVPSPRVWNDYIKYIENINGDKVDSVRFRSKKYSWVFYGMNISFHKIEKNYFGPYYNDPYIRGFLRDFFLRQSCPTCRYTSTARVSDFTIADWWGYKKKDEKDKDFQYKGVSLVLANSNKALDVVKNLNMELRERSIEEAKKTNLCLSRPYPKNPMREKFWEDYNSKSFADVVPMYMMPEKKHWSVLYLQKHKNTDRLIKVIRFLTIPSRVYNKFFSRFKKRMH